MNSFECTGNGSCRQYCEALLQQGVEVEITGESGCNVPGMFSIDQSGVDFDPKITEGVAQNKALLEGLGGALCNVLFENSKEDPEQQDVEELISCFDKTFDSRVTLWNAMLDATRDNRKFTDVELKYYQDKIQLSEEETLAKSAGAKEESIMRAQAAHDHKSLEEHKLLFDDQMIATVDRLVSNLMDGKPTLIVGDKGIAKTQAEKFVAKLWDPDKTPVIISGHGSMMSDELIGGMSQDKETGIFYFNHSKLVKAMIEGRPVIFDEVNVGDQSIVMRLQDIQLLRPGSTFILQENGDEEITIQPGYTIFATANEASARYQHRNILDPAFRDRYDVWKLGYPDSDNDEPIQAVPSSLMRIALAAAVDEHGRLSKHISKESVEKFVRLAHATQHLYSRPAKKAKISLPGSTSETTSNFLDDEPIMTDCITPRSMHDTIARCKEGNKPNMTIETEMEREIVGLDQAGSDHNQKHARGILTLLER